ncbi:hypothetical protein CEXT_38351 [Caerostris extrusa]|uniref:Maturase K n=1 Tax=Caerostris extrusa TaxID=172846 RepID=A0AAV4NTG8_CAEEX|nr:hypothetical protein CEXT_38351 [Caerostris extrusa]
MDIESNRSHLYYVCKNPIHGRWLDQKQRDISYSSWRSKFRNMLSFLFSPIAKLSPCFKRSGVFSTLKNIELRHQISSRKQGRLTHSPALSHHPRSTSRRIRGSPGPTEEEQFLRGTMCGPLTNSESSFFFILSVIRMFENRDSFFYFFRDTLQGENSRPPTKLCNEVRVALLTLQLYLITRDGHLKESEDPGDPLRENSFQKKQFVGH